MSLKRRSWYERESVACKNRLLARMFARDDKTAIAMDLVIVATQVGADIVRLAEKTGFTIGQIRPLERRLREALIWKGRTVDAREWRDLVNNRVRISVILTQAEVALGTLRRKQIEGAAVYTDCEGNEVARFPIPVDSRVITRFPRTTVGFQLTGLLGSGKELRTLSGQHDSRTDNLVKDPAEGS